MKKIEHIIFAGGCFWCTEAVFQRIEGVKEVIPGFSGGTIKNPAYREVCTGRTGHTESVSVFFDPGVVSLNTLLEVFFVTHDPTTLNRQGNDVGTHYRSAIFYTSEKQKNAIENFIKTLVKEEIFNDPIVTEVMPFEAFYQAEIEHYNYYNEHSEQPYCTFIINPKIEKLKKYYSDKLKTS